MKLRLRRVVVCVVVAAAVGLVAIWAYHLFARSREEYRRIRCRNNLNNIAKALATYLDQYGGQRYYPPNLGVLVDSGVMPDSSILVCPYDPDPPKLPNGLPCSYEYAAPKAVDDDLPPNEPIAWERKVRHGEGRCILYADSHVELTTRTEEELAPLDKRVQRSKNAPGKRNARP